MESKAVAAAAGAPGAVSYNFDEDVIMRSDVANSDDRAPTGALPWKFSQCFGEKSSYEDMQEADRLTAVEFGPTGEYLATGDKGGRVVVFKQTPRSPEVEAAQGKVAYQFYCEFQSHDPEFDYLKSLEIEEKINCIRWCRNRGNGVFLLSTNDKTVKLWKIYEKTVRETEGFNFSNGEAGSDDPEQSGAGTGAGGRPRVTQLRVPRTTSVGTTVTAVPRRVFSNAHAYHINSLSVNSDGESYMSADDLRINLWNLEITDHSFNIVDIKPENMEELTEVITSACFHPTQCNLFMYSSSRGCIRLGDMRQRALCDQHAKMFEVTEDGEPSFFSEIIASISDAKFADGGRYIVSRDYLTLKIWDINMESRPVRTINIHEHLRSKLCDLYENDCIFDKFECTVSGDGQYYATGSYNGTFHVYDTHGISDTCIEASRPPPPQDQCAFGRDVQVDLNALDFAKKTLHLSWHPGAHAAAIAGLNNLFIYSV